MLVFCLLRRTLLVFVPLIVCGVGVSCSSGWLSGTVAYASGYVVLFCSTCRFFITIRFI